MLVLCFYYFYACISLNHKNNVNNNVYKYLIDGNVGIKDVIYFPDTVIHHVDTYNVIVLPVLYCR